MGGGWRLLQSSETFMFEDALSVNIFGGIVRCDMIAEGIIGAVKEVGCEKRIGLPHDPCGW